MTENCVNIISSISHKQFQVRVNVLIIRICSNIQSNLPLILFYGNFELFLLLLQPGNFLAQEFEKPDESNKNRFCVNPNMANKRGGNTLWKIRKSCSCLIFQMQSGAKFPFMTRTSLYQHRAIFFCFITLIKYWLLKSTNFSWLAF